MIITKCAACNDSLRNLCDIFMHRLPLTHSCHLQCEPIKRDISWHMYTVHSQNYWSEPKPYNPST